MLPQTHIASQKFVSFQEKTVPTSTSSLINEASKMVGLPMSSPGNKATDVKAEKADDK